MRFWWKVPVNEAGSFLGDPELFYSVPLPMERIALLHHVRFASDANLHKSRSNRRLLRINSIKGDHRLGKGVYDWVEAGTSGFMLRFVTSEPLLLRER